MTLIAGHPPLPPLEELLFAEELLDLAELEEDFAAELEDFVFEELDVEFVFEELELPGFSTELEEVRTGPGPGLSLLEELSTGTGTGFVLGW